MGMILTRAVNAKAKISKNKKDNKNSRFDPYC